MDSRTLRISNGNTKQNHISPVRNIKLSKLDEIKKNLKNSDDED